MGAEVERAARNDVDRGSRFDAGASHSALPAMSVERTPSGYLRGDDSHARYMRLDVAKILKRFHFVERTLVKAQAGWIPSIGHFETKMALPEMLWQDAMTADACRERVFELRYPSRMMEVGDDAPLISLCEAAADAPTQTALLRALGEVFKPALLRGYEAYLEVADELADGPTMRFLQAAVRDKQEQVARLGALAEAVAEADDAGARRTADAWVEGLTAALDGCGGISLEEPRQDARQPALPGRTPLRIPDRPERDPRFPYARFYWPDTIDPGFPYGEGVLLQLRSAVSHLNEVWAVESAGAVLHAFADELGWEFVRDAARWTYDEARHTRMGYERLRRWGFEPAEMPVGSYIYDSAAGSDPVVRLGMLHYFETKNIGKKTERAKAFSDYHDAVSQRDMEFDWADETIHAHYGRHWLKALHARDPRRFPDHETLVERCEALVAETIAGATDEDRHRSRSLAQAMILKAERLVDGSARG